MLRSRILQLVVGLAMVGCTANFGDPAEERRIELNCPPEDGASEITSLRVVGAITIDGVLSEPSWDAARSITFANLARSDNSIEVKVLWDDDSLYLGYSTVDPQIEAGDLNLIRNDGSQIFIDTDHDPIPDLDELDEDDVRIVVDIEGGIQGPIVPNATQIIATGYVTEFSIPWAELGGLKPPETVMGILLANNDRDDGTGIQFDWLDLIETGPYARPYLWGDIHLSATLADGDCP